MNFVFATLNATKNYLYSPLPPSFPTQSIPNQELPIKKSRNECDQSLTEIANRVFKTPPELPCFTFATIDYPNLGKLIPHTLREQEALIQAWEKALSSRRFDVSFCFVSDVSFNPTSFRCFCRALAKLSTQKLCLSEIFIEGEKQTEMLKILFLHIKYKKELRELKLQSCDLRDEDAHFISEKIKNGHDLSTLTVLNLSDNLIADDGLRFLAESLNDSTAPKKIVLDNNYVTPDGFSWIRDYGELTPRLSLMNNIQGAI